MPISRELQEVEPWNFVTTLLCSAVYLGYFLSFATPPCALIYQSYSVILSPDLHLINCIKFLHSKLLSQFQYYLLILLIAYKNPFHFFCYFRLWRKWGKLYIIAITCILLLAKRKPQIQYNYSLYSICARLSEETLFPLPSRNCNFFTLCLSRRFSVL